MGPADMTAATMRGASAEALAELSGSLGTSRTLAEQATMGRELFGVAGILRSDAGLRRILTDTSVDTDRRAGLAEAVFGKAIGSVSMKLVTGAVGRRWTRAGDMPRAIEQLAVTCTVRSAGKDGDRVGAELFTVRQVVEANPGLRAALSDQTRSLPDRTGLLHGLLDDQALPATVLLLDEAVASGTVDRSINRYLDLAADALGEVVATVHTARDLTDDERERLVTALSRQYDAEVQLHLVVDPEMIGGLRVQIRDDVIDGTVGTRLDEARRKLAG